MRRIPLSIRVSIVLVLSSSVAAFAAPRLSRELAKKRISHLVDSNLPLDAIEIRRLTPQGDSETVAETTVTLAFQFAKNDKGFWTVEAVRLGDLDWLNMTELLAAIYHGNPPVMVTSSTPVSATSLTPADKFHTNPSDFEKQRRAMVELGASPLIPDAIEIRRVIAQSGTRAIVESTVTMGFRFRRQAKDWIVAAARLGDHEWVETKDVLATLNEGRRRDTVARMEKLAKAIDDYRIKNGAPPAARDIVELNDILHPTYISELVRVDGWGQPIEYGATGPAFRLTSKGPDGRWGTPDDVIVQH